jgi:hypothetical protein
MFFYALVTPPLLASIYMLFHLRRLKKHDKVLYRFCQLRRETMSLIRKGNFDLKLEDYIALRQLLEKTSETIHDFNNCKVSLFNIRNYSIQVHRAKSLEETSVERAPEIQELTGQYALAMLVAFFTFTPFIKSELVLRGFPFILKVLASISGNYLKGKLKKVEEIVAWIRHESENHAAALAAS